MQRSPHERRELTDWIRVLSASTHLDDRPTPQQIAHARATGILWVIYNDTLPEASRTVCEALELLALLARSDHRKWIAAVQQTWPEVAPLWLKVFDPTQRFRLGVEIIAADARTMETWCKEYYTPAAERAGSEYFRQLRGQLERAKLVPVAIPPQQQQDSRMPVCVRLGDLGDSHHSLWYTIREFAEATTATTTSSSSTTQCLFVLANVKIAKLHASWSKKAILHTHSMFENEIPVDPLCLQDTVTDMDESAFTVSALEQLMAIGLKQDDQSHDEQSHATRTCVTVNPDADDQTLDSIFSGLLVSHSIREIDFHKPAWVRCPRRDRSRLWKWLAIVFFSGREPDNTNQIETLHVTVSDLLVSEVEMLATTLSHTDPFSLLFPPPATATVKTVETSTDTGASESVVATATNFRLSRPVDGESRFNARRSAYSTGTEEPLRFINDVDATDDWTSVLLPGWGQAWVASTDMLVVKAATLPPSPPPRPKDTVSPHCRKQTIRPHRHLVLESFSYQQADMLLAFLDVVGSGLRKLTLSSCSFSSEWLRSVFTKCPGLTELTLHSASLPSLQLIADAYGEHHRWWPSQLVLHLRTLEDQANAFQFFEHLANKNHPMTQHLRVLHVVYRPRSTMPRLPESLHAMLEANDRLVEFQMLTWGQRQGGNDDAFDHYHGRLVRGPLALAARVAFLSVVESARALVGTEGGASSSTGTDRQPAAATAVAQLDNFTIATIFQFACGWRPRFVHVRL